MIRSLLVAVFLVALFASQAHAAAVLSLAQALEAAQTNNPKVLSALARTEAARGAKAGAGLLANPVLSAEADSAEQTIVLRQGLSLSGVQAAERAAAEEALVEARLRADAVRADVRAEATRAFYLAYGQQLRVGLAKDAADLDQQLLSLARKRFAVGDVPKLQVTQAQAVAAGSEAEVIAAEAGFQDAGTKLAEALGKTSLDNAELAVSRRPSPISAEASTSTAIQAARRAVRRAETDLRLANARRWSDIDLAAGSRRTMESGAPVALVRLGVEVPIPLFNRQQGAIAQAEAALASAKADLRSAEISAEVRVASARKRLAAANRRLDLLETNRLEQAQQLMDLARESARQGASSLLDVLEARRHWLAARGELIEAIVAGGEAAADLEAFRAP